jgi:hypothetical protein
VSIQKSPLLRAFLHGGSFFSDAGAFKFFVNSIEQMQVFF